MDAASPQNLQNVVSLLTHIVWLVGGVGAIIAAVSWWIGKVLADRILEKQKGNQKMELARLQTELQSTVNERLSRIDTELAIYRETRLSANREKIELYRAAVLPFIDLLINIEYGKLTKDDVATFDKERLKTYTQMVMFAPQSVMDAFDKLVNYLLDCLEGKQNYAWSEVRNRGLDLLNHIRADIGAGQGDIVYKGHR